MQSALRASKKNEPDVRALNVQEDSVGSQQSAEVVQERDTERNVT